VQRGLVAGGVVFALVCSWSCSKAGDEQSGKRAPISPPPPELEIPDGLSIPVEVEGGEAMAITRDQLLGLEPDFADTERRAWRLSRLVAALSPGKTIEATGREGVSITMQQPESPDEPQPVLFLTRRGEVVATVVRPEEPFPAYHGQGGRLRRPGDTTPRVAGVVKMRVFTRD